MVHGKSTNPYKEGGELRQKRLALQNSGNISKSKSAQINQLKTMESQARAKARAAVARAEEKAAREAEKPSSSSSSGSFTDQLAKVAGIAQ